MKNELLKQVYSPEDFRKRGHLLVDELADHLSRQLYDTDAPALCWTPPSEALQYWTDFLIHGDERSLFPSIVERTTNIHNPKYVGHQVAPTAPITALSAMVGALLNNGMAVYEMGMAPSAIERVVTDRLCHHMGYGQQARGFLTSGGTLANLTALLSARKAKVSDDIWNKGHSKALGIMVCEEAHYCIDRAAKIMGLGEKGIVKIPARPSYDMDISLLEEHYQKAQANGIHIFAIVGSAPSTATGIYDDLLSIAQFAQKYDLWFHVDGAHGGAAIFSDKYRHLLNGIEGSDSVVVDGHKMMMMPIITTALLFKDGKNASATFSQKADYLLTQSEDEDWYNSGKRAFECTKTMMSIHWYTLLKTYGESVFDQYLTLLFDLGNAFGELIKAHPHFELAVAPMSNIVCFRYTDAALDQTALNTINARTRLALLEEGKFYLVQTQLRGKHYLRTTLMNPFTTLADLEELLQLIVARVKST
jgi:L-2,4-diaminobutyrate decarboxylase